MEAFLAAARQRDFERLLKVLDPDVVLTADAGQLGQLFLNVLGNAIEAAGPGGWIEIRMRPETKPDAPPQSYRSPSNL